MARRAKAASPGCLVLFGVPFLAVGLGVLGYGVSCWMTYAASENWLRVDAHVETVEFETDHDSDGTTYSVSCTYVYEVDGTRYTGDRVSIMGGSSSEYDAHKKRFDILDGHNKGGTPVEAYVNPEDHTDAILFRDADLFMFVMIPFGLVFALIGGGVIAGGIYSITRKRNAERLAQEIGDKPWLFRDDWKSFRVVAGTVRDLALGWAMGLGIALFMSVFVIVMGDAPLFAKAIIGLFLVIAAALLVRAVLLTVSFAVHGTPELVLNEIPARPGQKMVGVIRTARSTIEPTGVKLTLVCRETHSSGDSQSTKDTYTREYDPPRESVEEDGRMLVPVIVDVPTGFGPTSEKARRTWVLKMKAKATPLALKAEFELPVFEADDADVMRRGD